MKQVSKGSGACEGSELTSRAPVTCQQRHKLPTGLLPCYIPLLFKPINDNLKPRLEKVLALVGARKSAAACEAECHV